MLTQERVKELFRYEDGNLIRKVNVGSRGRAGNIAGGINSKGYLRTMVDGKHHFNHRLIFLFHYGYVSENQIDHIDRDRTNNKINNLREVSNSCNVRNSTQQKSVSGIKGVSWHKPTQKWVVHIWVIDRNKHIGIFTDFTEAVAHRLAAEQCLNWTDCDSNSPAFQYINSYIRGLR